MRGQISTTGSTRSCHSWRSLIVLLALLMPVLAACGGDDNSGEPISWQPGLPAATIPSTSGDGPSATTPAETDADATATTETGETPAEPTATTAESAGPSEPGPTGRALTDEELAQYQPNELGKIMVIEYHNFTNDPGLVAQFVRTFDMFRADLQWLYDNGYYVVSLTEVIENRITAPAGKRPVAMTFDDSTANQFRFLIRDDGSLTVDPESAVGVMESFYAQHPDFGRGGVFGVNSSSCFFSDVGSVVEDDQIDLCGEKITWLLDNGYEVENHTVNHANLFEVDDETFKAEIAGNIDALQAFDSRVKANILVVPFGVYPSFETRQEQRDWLQNGFEWNGNEYFIIGSLMVGAEPAFSPASTEWDSMWIYRLQMCDCTEVGGFGWDDYWQDVVTNDPGIIYVSDGNPDTITVPETVNTGVFGDISDSTRETHEIIRY